VGNCGEKWNIILKKIVWIKPPCPDPLSDTPKIPPSENPYFDHFRAAQDEELFNLIEIKLPIDRSFYSSVNFSIDSFVLTFFNTSFNTL
jgi:hypothetical protein